MEILVVEDEPSIADFLMNGLRAEGHAVTCAADGVEGERLATGEVFDLVILDLMLPRRHGLAVLEGIRSAKPDLPVIVLTARGETATKIAGLDAGATDYVTKPFSFDELAARVRAQSRARGSGGPPRLEAAGIRADLITRKVARDGAPVLLSSTEFELLAYFLRHPNRILSRDQIHRDVWGYDHDPGTNVVGVYVGYLRRKLERTGRPAPIQTVRSAGYRLVADG